MKSPIIAAAVIAATAALPVHADRYRDDHRQRTDFARVTEVSPIYQTVTHHLPERSCWTETRYQPVSSGYQSATPTILGTLIGGAIGNELGHNKTNKRVGTVAGAVLGASIGRDWSARNTSTSNRVRPVSEEVCEVNERVEYEERIVGYNVSYRYQGEVYHTQMDHHPGDKIKVAVNVTPIH